MGRVFESLLQVNTSLALGARTAHTSMAASRAIAMATKAGGTTEAVVVVVVITDVCCLHFFHFVGGRMPCGTPGITVWPR